MFGKSDWSVHQVVFPAVVAVAVGDRESTDGCFSRSTTPAGQPDSALLTLSGGIFLLVLQQEERHDAAYSRRADAGSGGPTPR